MGKQLTSITPQLQEFIERQPIFFVGTAMEGSRVNVSPKGMDTFRVLGPNRAMWLNLTGSGNETATHLLHDGRITIMFCAFEGKPLILRLYGQGKVYHARDPQWQEHIGLFPPIPGSRQLIDIEIDLVQTSCGMAVPFMDFKGERDSLKVWAEKKGDADLETYRQTKNTTSLDGFPTGL